MDEKQIEDLLRERGIFAPRLSPAIVDDAVDPMVDVQYHNFPGTAVIVCLLTLRNGFALVGKSAAVSMDNFSDEVGRQVAYKDARNKMWEFLGFALHERIAVKLLGRGALPPEDEERLHNGG